MDKGFRVVDKHPMAWMPSELGTAEASQLWGPSVVQLNKQAVAEVEEALWNFRRQ
jgi:hypothetical protein